MLDIKFIRENKDLISEAARKKRLDFKVEHLLEVDDKRRGVMVTIEKKRSEQNSFNARISNVTDPAERERDHGRGRYSRTCGVLQRSGRRRP